MATNTTFERDRRAQLRFEQKRELDKLRDRVFVAQGAIRLWKKQQPAQRRQMLASIRAMAIAARKAEKAERARLVRRVAVERSKYVAWWAEVQREKLRRLEELRRLRAELADFRKGAKGRRVELRATLAGKKALAEDDLHERLNREGEVLYGTLDKAKRALKDGRTTARIVLRSRAAKAPKASRRESMRELQDGVEANLAGNAIAMAFWRQERRRILADARKLGRLTADGVAELAAEMAEHRPEEALDFLMADVEKWVQNETRKRSA